MSTKIKGNARILWVIACTVMISIAFIPFISVKSGDEAGENGSFNSVSDQIVFSFEIFFEEEFHIKITQTFCGRGSWSVLFVFFFFYNIQYSCIMFKDV